ncbi:MAG: HAMP domain-containing sensor histidine kinase [Myxococcota bacterium]
MHGARHRWHHRHHRHRRRYWERWWLANKDGIASPRIRHRLHKRIFRWFGAAILASVLTAGAIFTFTSGDFYQSEYARMTRFASEEFADRWDDPVARASLARRLADGLALSVVLEDSAGQTLDRFGVNACIGAPTRLPVRRGDSTLGAVLICASRSHQRSHMAWLLPLFAAAFVLWGAASKIAWRLVRPLGDLVRVTQEIGRGNLGARASLDCRTPDEVGVVAEAVNDMAARIERQLSDMRALQASVSHELRTPLGHVRILLEMARQKGADPKIMDEIEAEAVEMDGLVGTLLAQSQLDFALVSKRPLEAQDLARRALERAGLPSALAVVPESPKAFDGDPTLIGRALANLIDNAVRHAGGLDRLVVESSGERVLFAAEDRGKGFLPGEADKAFEPFHRSGDNGNLGLGLALVRRVAEAHGGGVFAENKQEGGARVGIWVPVTHEVRAAEQA